MWYWLEKFLSNPIAFAFMLVFGSFVLRHMYLKEKARNAPAQPARGTASGELDLTKPGTGSSPSQARAETGRASGTRTSEVGEDTVSRRRGAGAGGFREHRWGSAPAPEMVSYHDAGDSVLYVRGGDVLKLGDAPLTSILYSYWKGRLEAVVIDMPDASADRVMAKLVADWGEPKRPPGTVTKFFWTDVGSGDQATHALLEKTPLARKACLTLTSKSIKAEKARESTGARPLR